MAWIPDVNPNELIESAWGNDIRDRTVTPFTNAAERVAAIPTPDAGMVTYLTASDTLEYWNGTSWRMVGPGQLAYKTVLTQQAGISTSPVDITGLSATVTLPAGRRVQLTASISFYKSAPDGSGYSTAQLTDGAGGLLMDRNTNHAASSYASLYIVNRFEPLAGVSTWKVRAATNVGFVNIEPSSLFIVEDVGPASMPD